MIYFLKSQSVTISWWNRSILHITIDQFSSHIRLISLLAGRTRVWLTVCSHEFRFHQTRCFHCSSSRQIWIDGLLLRVSISIKFVPPRSQGKSHRFCKPPKPLQKPHYDPCKPPATAPLHTTSAIKLNPCKTQNVSLHAVTNQSEKG